MGFFEDFATVRDVLDYKASVNPDHAKILTVPSSASFSALLSFLADHHIGVVFVRDAKTGKVAGLISERDVIRHLTMVGEDAFDLPITEMLSPRIFSCGRDLRLKLAAEMMSDAHVRHMAVLDEQGEYVGVVSSTDVELFAGKG